MTYHFKVGDDVQTSDGVGRIINRQDGNFHVQLQHGVYVYTAEMMKPLEENSSFEQNVRRILNGVADIVIARNKEYGNSALDPVHVFSKSDRMEQLKVQLDHKLSRIARGGDPGIDTLRDLIGYEVLYIMAMETE